MERVNHLNYKISFKNAVSGTLDSPIKFAFNIGGSSPNVFDKVLTITEDGLMVFHDSATNELYSNRKPVLSEDGETLTFEK